MCIKPVTDFKFEIPRTVINMIIWKCRKNYVIEVYRVEHEKLDNEFENDSLQAELY